MKQKTDITFEPDSPHPMIEIVELLKTISTDLKELKEQSKKDGDAIYNKLLLLRGI